MKMVRFLGLCLSLIMVVGLLAGCGASGQNTGDTGDNKAKDNVEQGKYEDGIYFAKQDQYDESSGWKSIVTLEVKDGKIVRADWNALSIKGGDDKKTASKNGSYGMKAKGNASAEWHEQAEKVEAYLLETQDPTKIEYKDNEGHTDAISGATIHVNDFFELAKKALDSGPLAKGQYKDGFYRAEAKEFDESSGWKGTVDIAVVGGRIVDANWNAVHKDGGDDKKTSSMKGDYGMKSKGNASAEWHEQAEKVEAYLLETQDPTKIEYKDNEGYTDAISGATIHVNEFFELAQEALAQAK